MYILRTWTYDTKSPEGETPEDLKAPSRHPTKLDVYIANGPLRLTRPEGVPYITTDKFRAKKFYTKKQAIEYAKAYGGCYVDCVWYFQESLDNGYTIDLWG